MCDDAQDAVDAMATRLDALKEAAQKNMSAVDDLLGAVEEDRTDTEELLDQGQTAQQVPTNQNPAEGT